MRRARTVVLLLLASGLAACGQSDPAPSICRDPGAGVTCQHLSSYALFDGGLSAQQPTFGVVPFAPNSALFSDYATKLRFLYVPAGTQAQYDDTGPFSFPPGTIVIKTFTYPFDLRDPAKGQRIVETRLLIHRSGGWVALPYVWNDEQTEATLQSIGTTVAVSWIHTDGLKRSDNYVVPNTNQCKECHEDAAKITNPIGLQARHLNRDYPYPEGAENQLAHFSRLGLLKGAPAPENAPRLVAWDDQTAPLNDRARAWLEINCAHCHNPQGSARTTGLDLLAAEMEPYAFGVCKGPVAAGKGTGGHLFGIVPGDPDNSILQYRIESTLPGVEMPETGRHLTHVEGVALVRSWIQNMPPLKCK